MAEKLLCVFQQSASSYVVVNDNAVPPCYVCCVNKCLINFGSLKEGENSKLISRTKGRGLKERIQRSRKPCSRLNSRRSFKNVRRLHAAKSKVSCLNPPPQPPNHQRSHKPQFPLSQMSTKQEFQFSHRKKGQVCLRPGGVLAGGLVSNPALLQFPLKLHTHGHKVELLHVLVCVMLDSVR